MGTKQFYVRDESTGSTFFVEDTQAALALPVVSASQMPNQVAGALGVKLVTDPQFAGGAIAGQNSSTQIQAALNSGGIIVFPGPGPWIAAGLSIPSGVMQLEGGGRIATTIKLADNANTDLFQVVVGPQPKFVDLTLDGNKANNSSGHIVNFLTASGMGYQGSGEFHACTLLNAPVDAIHADVGRGNGACLDGTRFGAAGRHNIFLDGADWILDAVTAGTAGDANLYLNNASSTRVYGGVFTGAQGLSNIFVGQPTYGCVIEGADIDGSHQHGIYVYSYVGGENFRTLPNQHRIAFNQFFNNSTNATGVSSDILFRTVCGAQVIGNSFTYYGLSNSVPKYHLEEQQANQPSQQIVFSGNNFRTVPTGASGGKKTYGTGVTNIADIARFDIDQLRAPKAIIAGRNLVTV